MNLSARQRNELVEALLACASVSAGSTRDTIVSDLPGHIRSSVQRGPTDQEDVANIVRACLNYANGLEDLIAIVRAYEHDSVAMQDVDRLLLHLFDFQIAEEGLGLRLLASAGDVDTRLERLRGFYRELLPSGVAPQEEPLGLFAMLSHLWNVSCKPGGVTSRRTFPIVDFAEQLALAAGGRRVAADFRSWADEAQKLLFQMGYGDIGTTATATQGMPADGSRQTILAGVLASLYPTIEAAGEVVAAARLNPVNIQFNDRALPNWQSILAEAARRDRVKAVVDAALAGQPGNPWLLLARRELRPARQEARRPAARTSKPGEEAALERVIAHAPGLPTDLSFLERALVCARSVGRVMLQHRTGMCTGFLCRGNLLIVPHHCIRSAEEAAAAQVQFNYQRTAKGLDAQLEEFDLAPEEAFATSGIDQGDWTAVRVRGDPNARYGVLDLAPTEPKMKDPVSLIHHIYGGPKQVELLVGVVAWVGAGRLQYTLTGGRPGASGAPVFDDNWALVGMHRAARINVDGISRGEAVNTNTIVEGLTAAGLYAPPAGP